MSGHSSDFVDGVAFSISYIEKVGRALRKKSPPGCDFGVATCDGIVDGLTDWIAREKSGSDE